MNFIFYAGIGVFVAHFLSYLMMTIDPANRDFKIGLFNYIIGGGLFSWLFFVLGVVISLILLNLFWKQYVFDVQKRNIAISCYIFFFRLREEYKIPFNEASINIERKFFPGDPGGYVWLMELITSNERHDLGFSIFKRRLEKKKELIEKILNQN